MLSIVRSLCRRGFGALALAGVLVGLGPSTAPAASIMDHWALTHELLPELGWDDPALVRQVAECNICTDLARPRKPLRQVTRILFPRSGIRMDGVMALASTAPFNDRAAAGFHFNSLYSFSDIAGRWDALEAWARTTREQLDSMPPGPLRRDRCAAFTGLLMHAVHDFYVHANWVEILDRYGPGMLRPEDFPTWEELVENEGGWRQAHPQVRWSEALGRMRLSDIFRSDRVELGGLQTGRIRFEEIEGLPRPWRHRHAGGDTKRVVDALARRAVTRWVQEYADFEPAPRSPGR